MYGMLQWLASIVRPVSINSRNLSIIKWNMRQLLGNQVTDADSVSDEGLLTFLMLPLWVLAEHKQLL